MKNLPVLAAFLSSLGALGVRSILMRCGPRIAWPWLLVLVTVCAMVPGVGSTQSISPTYRPVRSLDLAPYTAGSWLVEAFEGFQSGDPEPVGPSKLCFFRSRVAEPQSCFVAHGVSNGTAYDFQYAEELFVVTFPRCSSAPPHGILYVSKFWGHGSGYLRFFTLWSLPSFKGSARNILPPTFVTERGEYLFVARDKDGCKRFFATADFVWSQGETHFDSHYYWIHIYEYGIPGGKYVSVTTYQTAVKYQPTYGREVLDHELARIQRLIATR